jgi:hypothetical protein
MRVLVCQKCGAGLGPVDLHDDVACIYCKTMRGQEADPLDDELRSSASPGEEAARIAMTDEAVLALLRQHFAGAESTSLCPSITGKKELGARAIHARHLPSDERVLMLYDDTIFGSGDEGFVVTSRRICWRNAGDRPHMIEWQQVDPDRMYADRRRLVLGTRAIEITGDESIMEACERAFHVLAFSARAPASANNAGSGIALVQNPDSSAVYPSIVSPSGRPMTEVMPQAPPRPSKRPTLRPSHQPTLQSAIGPQNATPPPANAVSYDSYVVHAASQRGPAFACWCCNTPLYWNTPQCAHCHALPTPQGWRRTG